MLNNSSYKLIPSYSFTEEDIKKAREVSINRANYLFDITENPILENTTQILQAWKPLVVRQEGLEFIVTIGN
jgi:hypothetical protein